MPYTFKTIEGSPLTLPMRVNGNADLYTVTAEFTEHEWSKFEDEPVILVKPVTTNGRDISFTLTADEVRMLKSAYFRIKAVKDGEEFWIESGRLQYHPLPSVAEVRGDNLYLVDSFGREFNAGNVRGPIGPAGPVGADGAIGPQGPPGPAPDTSTFATITYVDGADAAAKDRASHTGTQVAATISDFADAARNAQLSNITDGAVHGSEYPLGVSVLTVTDDRTAFPNWPDFYGTIISIRSIPERVFQIAEFGNYYKFRVWEANYIDVGVPGWSEWWALLDGYPWRSKGRLAVGPLDEIGVPASLLPGPDGQVLTTDAATATGLKWSGVAMTQAERDDLAAATDANTNRAIVRRSATNTFQIGQIGVAATPTAASHVTRKDYVDGIGTAAESANTIMRRNAAGNTAANTFIQINAPTAADHLTRRDWVEANGALVPAVATTAPGPTPTLAAANLPSTRTWTLNANATIGALPTPAADRAGTITLIIKQPATGGPYTVTFPTIPWAEGAPAPTMPTAANAELEVHLFWTGQAWRGKVGGTYYP